MATRPPSPHALATGVIYLLYFLTAILSRLLITGLIVFSNPELTATILLAHESRFRSSIATGLIATALYITLTALFYALFKPVSRTLSLLAAFFSLTGCAIQAGGAIFQMAPLLLLSGTPTLRSFTSGQLQSLSLLSLRLNTQMDAIGLVFFALYCLMLGYLILRSTFLPRFLGILLALDGLGWLTYVYPPLAAHCSPYIQILGVLAELALMLWLLIRGVDLQRWQEQATNTPTHPPQRA